MENNRPRGREKNVTGQSASVHKRGEGLNTGGPVGKSDGYQGRKEQYNGGGQSSGGNRAAVRKAGGGGLLLIVLIIAAVFLLGKGKLSNCTGLLNPGTDTPSYTNPPQNQGSQGGLDFSGVLGSLMGGGFTNGGTASTGWTNEANTGKLNTSVAAGARAKRTQIMGGGRDTVTTLSFF